MTIHQSFRLGSAMAKHRNVLTRAERLEKLEAKGDWNEKEDSLFGVPKVRSIKPVMKKKKKKEGEEEGGEA